MRKVIIPIERGATPQETGDLFIKALDEATTRLSSYKSKAESIDIILAHDDGGHNYMVLASVVAKQVGIGYDKEITIWQNEKGLKTLGLNKVSMDKKAFIKQILDKAFNEVGNLYNLISLRSEQSRLDSVYNWLAQMLDANFELKSDDHGRI